MLWLGEATTTKRVKEANIYLGLLKAAEVRIKIKRRGVVGNESEIPTVAGNRLDPQVARLDVVWIVGEVDETAGFIHHVGDIEHPASVLHLQLHSALVQVCLSSEKCGNFF